MIYWLVEDNRYQVLGPLNKQAWPCLGPNTTGFSMAFILSGSFQFPDLVCLVPEFLTYSAAQPEVSDSAEPQVMDLHPQRWPLASLPDCDFPCFSGSLFLLSGEAFCMILPSTPTGFSLVQE